MRAKKTSKIVICALLAAAMPAYAQNQPSFVAPVITQGVNTQMSSSFDIFKPRPGADRRRLDYQVWDDMLQNIVVNFGLSTRIRATRPYLNTGTRVVSGHTSPYRLEGSRVESNGHHTLIQR